MDVLHPKVRMDSILKPKLFNSMEPNINRSATPPKNLRFHGLEKPRSLVAPKIRRTIFKLTIFEMIIDSMIEICKYGSPLTYLRNINLYFK